jgi:hypothetical protein
VLVLHAGGLCLASPRPILTFEEIERLAGVFVRLGASKIRLTGGEPTLRHDLPDLVARLAAIPGVADLAMTTNALLLSRFAGALRRAGLRRITVSLDTLRPERFRDMTRADRLPEALGGIAAAQAEGFEGLKLNAVVVRGVNDDELFDLLEFGRARGMEVRFIEYMDVGGATRWSDRLVVPRSRCRARAARAEGGSSTDRDPAAPARRFAAGRDAVRDHRLRPGLLPHLRPPAASRPTGCGTLSLRGKGVSLRTGCGPSLRRRSADLIQRGWTGRGAATSGPPGGRGLYQIDGPAESPKRCYRGDDGATGERGTEAGGAG